MGYCTHESRLVLRSAEIQPFIPRFVRFSCAIDLCRLIVQICTPTNTYTHTHTIGSIHIGSTHTHTHTHTYRVARHLLPGALLLYTPLQRPGVVSLATVPAPTHVCVCLCARTHVAPGNDDRGFFLCIFQVESPDVVHIPCHTPPAPCAFHVENSFSDPILQPGVLHISTHTPLCLDAVKCVSPSQHSTCLHAVLLFHILEIDTEEEGKETND